MELCGSLNALWHCLSLGLEWKLTFSSPVATAEFYHFNPVNAWRLTSRNFQRPLNCPRFCVAVISLLLLVVFRSGPMLGANCCPNGLGASDENEERTWNLVQWVRVHTASIGLRWGSTLSPAFIFNCRLQNFLWSVFPKTLHWHSPDLLVFTPGQSLLS